MAVDKKQEELQKMYALRAGLSIISQKCDKLENDNRCVQKMKTEVMQLKNQIIWAKLCTTLINTLMI